MKLDRNIPGNKGRGKYALINHRRLLTLETGGGGLGRDGVTMGSIGVPRGVYNAIRTLENAGVWEWGATPEDEFFVIKLKDVGARAALAAYADVYDKPGGVPLDDEYAAEIREMAARSGKHHPLCKIAD